MKEDLQESPYWGRARTLKITFATTADGGREWSFSVSAFGLLAPLALAIVVVVAAALPRGREAPIEVPESVSDIITPLNVRDPSALVMGPGGGIDAGACSCPGGKRR